MLFQEEQEDKYEMKRSASITAIFGLHATFLHRNRKCSLSGSAPREQSRVRSALDKNKPASRLDPYRGMVWMRAVSPSFLSCEVLLLRVSPGHRRDCGKEDS